MERKHLLEQNVLLIRLRLFVFATKNHFHLPKKGYTFKNCHQQSLKKMIPKTLLLPDGSRLTNHCIHHISEQNLNDDGAIPVGKVSSLYPHLPLCNINIHSINQFRRVCVFSVQLINNSYLLSFLYENKLITFFN